MLHKEDYHNGRHLTAEQAVFGQQFVRRGSSAIRSGSLRRKLLSIALVPLAYSEYPEYRDQFDPDMLGKPFVLGKSVGIVTMSDHPLETPKRNAKIETRVLVNVGFIDTSGAPCVGGYPNECRLATDFVHGPLTVGQKTSFSRRVGMVHTPVAGVLQLTRSGPWLDVGVREPNGDTHEIMRIDFTHIEHECVTFLVNQMLVDQMLASPTVSHDPIELGTVLKSQPVLDVRKPCSYYVCDYQHNTHFVGFVYGAATGVFPAELSELFSALNGMVELQNDTILLPYESRPPLVEPQEWAFRPYVAFEAGMRQRADSQYVDVDPYDLTSIPEFEPSAALKSDLIAALGPGGDLPLRSEHNGCIEAIEHMPDQPHLIKISFKEGAEQLIPATSVLYRVILNNVKRLEPGDNLSEGMLIGDICPRVKYASWDILSEVLQDNINWVIQQFLSATSVKPEEHDSGDYVLYDTRYVSSVLSYCATDDDNDAVWFWDLRKATKFYDTNVKAIVLPPVRYPNWENLAFVVNGISFDLSNPHESTERYSPKPIAEKRSKRGHRGGGSKKQTVGDRR